MKTKAIIVDIDGTVADLTHRLHHIKNKEGKKDFDKFFADAPKDTPKQNVIDIVKLLAKKYELIFLTGRPQKCRSATIEWLWNEAHFSTMEFTFGLLMRPDGNYTPDDELKQKIYEEKIEPYFEVIAVFDDRQCVVDMWRKIGLTCFQVEQWEE